MPGASRFIAAALILTSAACAHGHGTGQPQPAGPPVTVIVTNNYKTDIEAFAVGTGTSYRLGTVSPGIARSFELGQGTISSDGRVRFMAQVTGFGPRFQSDDVLVAPGDVVYFEITTNLLDSRVTVRP